MDVAQVSPQSQVEVPLSTWVLISHFKLSYNLLRRPDGSFNRHLAEYLDRKVPPNPFPVEGVATTDALIDRVTGLWGRIFWECESPEMQDQVERQDQVADGHIAHQRLRAREPRDHAQVPQQGKPLVIYFHGGSFVHSSANSAIYDAMCRRLVKMCGVVILSVNFRRAPENPCPCAYEDGMTSLRWTRSFQGLSCLGHLGCDPFQRCYLAGDSSGGNIAHNVAVRAADEGLSLAGIVLLMPMFGGERRTPAEWFLDGQYFVTMNDRDWYWRAFLPFGANREHPACNPFSEHAPSLMNVDLPPYLLVVGGCDLLQDWQLQFAHSLQQAGKKVSTMFLERATMGFFLLPNSGLFYSLVERFCEFFNVHR